ncbi:hypothetical protein SH668x_002393 [Planctomicrobium sp. SH668]|uniref:hypothetical protein n=1 Tax=Planctomicrobium sp. SH668 TaxID=3448126 RepID=UPI003F5C38EE
MSTEANVLVLSKDLFFTSQIHGAVQRAGRKGRTCLSMNGCLQQLSTGPHDCILIDLEMPELDFARLREAAGPDCKMYAYGPHVRVELFEAAQKGGCDAVLTRGQACAKIEAALRNSVVQ